MVTGGGAHLQQTHTKNISLRSTAVLFYTIKVLPLYLYVVDSNRSTQLQQPADQHKPNNSSPSNTS